MNKTKIDWCDMTWNPVTGCLHNCEYCYARKIANRFNGGGYGKQLDMFFAKYKDDAFNPPYVLDKPQYKKTKAEWFCEAAYPFGFEPTFHRYRLDEPQKIKTPQRIFVCSMADLFGEWVPDEWIQEVFRACEKAPQHQYLFLTKNPKRWAGLFKSIYFTDDFIDKMWFGQTLSTLKQPEYVWAVPNHFLSIEPLLEEPKIDKGILFGTSWVIIGQQTNPTITPKDEWVQSIIDECKEAKVPIFIKDPLYKRFPIQEYPTGLRKEK